MSAAPFNPFERIDKDKAALLIVDHQVGLFQLVRDYSPEEFRANIITHASIGKTFNLPVVLTTSTETGEHWSSSLKFPSYWWRTGPNSTLPTEITDMYPDTPIVKRSGEINAWDNADFRKAVEATGKEQLIIAGIVTDVRTVGSWGTICKLLIYVVRFAPPFLPCLYAKQVIPSLLMLKHLALLRRGLQMMQMNVCAVLVSIYIPRSQSSVTWWGIGETNLEHSN
jgi:hypothetical protein